MLAPRSLALFTCLALAGCPDPDPKPEPLTFTPTAEHPTAAILSAGGTGVDDVWLVGAQPATGQPPLALHWDGKAWKAVDTKILHDLWWVHAFKDGPVFLSGGGASVLRVDGDVVTRLPTPEFFGNTVFGVWGSAPDDVWAVGGFAGREGFIWHWDGETFSDVALPADLPRTDEGEIPALFKVWGRGADDVWVVGGLGTILHFDGDAWKVVPSGVTDTLFTVTGTADDVLAVGGANEGVVLRGGTAGFERDTPPDAPLLQGITVDHDGVVWVAGANGYTARHDGRWSTVDLGLAAAPQSIHALWADRAGDLWAVGGGVLSPALDKGVACSSLHGVATWAPTTAPPPVAECPADKIDKAPTQSIARRWSELLIDSIRRDIPHPPKHARNLHHVSVAMYDAWAAYTPDVHGVVFDDAKLEGSDEDIATAISYAALRVLSHRYATAIGAATSLDCYTKFMDVLGLDPADEHRDGDDPIAVGNRIGFGVVERFADDGANEANGYVDTTGWAAGNPVMVVDRIGTNVVDPDVWQQLNLGTAETQNGIVLESSVQPYIGAHWREVEPFAVSPDPDRDAYGDPLGDFPSVTDPEMADWVVEMIQKEAELDVDDGEIWDIGPNGRGNNPLGTNDGAGYSVNPATGQPYAENRVKRGDFTRIVAEMWADGPSSETPPGHWLVLSNQVSDALAERAQGPLVPYATGAEVDRLAWDVGLYLSVTGATHDAAIVAWGMKRESLGPRPITLVRWMAQHGQRTDPSAISYHVDGLPLVPGLIEEITAESAAPGERHHALRWYIGEIAVRGWRGEPGNRTADHTRVGWMRALEWIPYQRRTFVTPAFPGFISGHSTFSRAAAEVLAAYTGSPYFPGGMFEYVAKKDAYLIFENGPSEDVHLQWATYYDAADQAGQSRLWGGIHIWPDDRVGRINGSNVGLTAIERARSLLGRE